MMALRYLRKTSGSSWSNWKREKCVLAYEEQSRGGTNLFKVSRLLLLDGYFDPIQDVFEALQVDTGDSESLASAVVQEVMTDAITEDHGDITRKFGLYTLQGRVFVLLVEDRDVGSGVIETVRAAIVRKKIDRQKKSKGICAYSCNLAGGILGPRSPRCSGAGSSNVSAMRAEESSETKGDGGKDVKGRLRVNLWSLMLREASKRER